MLNVRETTPSEHLLQAIRNLQVAFERVGIKSPLAIVLPSKEDKRAVDFSLRRDLSHIIMTPPRPGSKDLAILGVRLLARDEVLYHE